MALAVALLGSGIISMGPYSWLWLAAITAVGFSAIWIFTERAWGKFINRDVR